MSTEQLLNSEQAADYLGVSKTKFAHLSRDGRLRAEKIDGRLYFDQKVLERFKKNYTPKMRWTLETALAEARKYRNANLFLALSGGAHQFLRKNHPEVLQQLMREWLR